MKLIMPKLVVCGCSWSSECHINPDTGYGTYLADMLNAEYINLARPSASNYIIRLQVDYAVKNLNPDLIVVAWTSPLRFDWHYDSSKTFDGSLRSVSYFDDEVRNNNYHPIENDPCITAESWNSIFGKYKVYYPTASDVEFTNLPQSPISKKFLSEQQFNILKQYYLNFVSLDLEKHKQQFLIESAVHQLTKSNTKFLMSTTWKDNVDCIPAENYVDIHPVDIKNMFTKSADQDNYTHHLTPKQQNLYATKYLFPKAENLLKMDKHENNHLG